MTSLRCLVATNAGEAKSFAVLPKSQPLEGFFGEAKKNATWGWVLFPKKKLNQDAFSI